MKKRYKLNKMGRNTYYLELMLILINFYQQQKLTKKDILTEILFLRKKKTIQVVQKNGCDLDHEVGNIEAFIDEFKNKK